MLNQEFSEYECYITFSGKINTAILNEQQVPLIWLFLLLVIVTAR